MMGRSATRSRRTGGAEWTALETSGGWRPCSSRRSVSARRSLSDTGRRSTRRGSSLLGAACWRLRQRAQTDGCPHGEHPALRVLASSPAAQRRTGATSRRMSRATTRRGTMSTSGCSVGWLRSVRTAPYLPLFLKPFSLQSLICQDRPRLNQPSVQCEH